MAKLTEEEQAQFEAFQKKMEAPDEPPVGKTVTYVVDLGDDAQVKRARKMGFLPDDLDAEESKDGDEGEEELDETPKRRGYFKE